MAAKKKKKATVTKPLSPVAKRRNVLFEEMPQKLRDATKEIGKLFRQAAKGTMLICWDAGAMIKEVIEKENKYGSSAVERIAAYYNESASYLYELRNLAVEYTRDEIAALSKRAMDDGQHITLSHALAVMRIKSPESRKKLWDRVFAESMSKRDVLNEVASRHETGKTRSAGAGRPPAIPKSPEAGVRKLNSQLQRLHNIVPIVHKHAFDKITGLEEERLTDQLEDQLTTTQGLIVSLQKELAETEAKTQKGLARVKQVKKLRADVAKKKSSAKPKPKSKPASKKKKAKPVKKKAKPAAKKKASKDKKKKKPNRPSPAK